MKQYLTLVLNNHRIKVNRKKLASKSQYFASLFSHNFSDSNSEEHVVNYDIPLYTLQVISVIYINVIESLHVIIVTI